MLKLALLLLTVSGLQAIPIAAPKLRASSAHHPPGGVHHGIQGSDIIKPIPNDFRQGTEPSRRFLVDLNTGLVKDYINEMDRRVVPDDVPALRHGAGWVRVEEPSSQLPDGFQHDEPVHKIPDGFRQGTEPFLRIQDGMRQGTEPFLRIQDGMRQGTEPFLRIPDGFRQGTEPFLRIPDGFRQGTEPFLRIPDGFRQGTEPFMRIPDGFRQGTEPFMRIPDGFRQGTEPFMRIPDGFRQGTEPVQIPGWYKQGPLTEACKGEFINGKCYEGTEPFLRIQDGMRQGTEPFLRIQDGMRQGTEPFLRIPDGFRQGTEPFMRIPDGFRQGTEPFMRIPDGFRQGTEPFMRIPDGFRQGTEPFMRIPEGFRQGTEPVQIPGVYKQGPLTEACKGEFINGKCYEFNPTPMAFKEAQASCRSLAPNAELASVASDDLNSRLVSLVTEGGKNNPVLTWLGATIENHLPSWVDGSEWSYSNWMPGHPNFHTDKRVCVEMFKRGERWWTAADCELKRSSICSYPIAA